MNLINQSIPSMVVVGPVLCQICQIFLLAVVFYWIMRLLKGTPGLLQLGVIIITITLLHWLTDFFKLAEIKWLLANLFKSLPVIIVILFSEEIRKVFANFTNHIKNKYFNLGRSRTRYSDEVLQSLCNTVDRLATSKTGALIAMERVMSLEQLCHSGKIINAEFCDNDLIENIFYKGSPLHDGGIIIREGRLAAAACVFPPSKDTLPSIYGLRHRAAMGMSQQTDALVIVVSEEKGIIHVVLDGNMTTIVTRGQLLMILNRCFLSGHNKKKKNWKSRLKNFGKYLSATFNLFKKNLKKEKRD